MKRGSHEIGVACAGPRDVSVHGTCDRIVFEQVDAGSRMDGAADCTRGLFWCRFERTVYAPTAPSLYLVLIGEDRVLPFMFTPVNGHTFVVLPAPYRPFATVKVACD